MISYKNVLAVARLLSALPCQWFVSGGWAIDLFAGKSTREHEDLEVGIFRPDQGELHRLLSAWELSKAVRGPDGGTYVPWPAGEWLDLPIHQILARREGSDPPEFEFFLNEVADGQWRFRRNQQLTRPRAEVSVVSVSGLPIVAPEIQLLYKAHAHRPKDDEDFQTALPLLDARQRAWLKTSLQLLYPADPWLTAL
jgi:hypothetical protein